MRLEETAMAQEADLVIRGGLIADGSGGEPFIGDVALTGGKIAAVGPNLAVRGREEIDGAGHVVTPGFVDIHTHYDGQVTWEHRLRPTSSHGVTTTVMGNCGIGFAPCKPQDRQRLIRLMEGVEDLPEPVLAAGLPWNWTSFPEYLDSLAARQYDIDFAAQLPHSALRVYAMGERGVEREAATPDDVALMARLAREAVEAGALGFSTSRTINHRASDGRHVPTLTAAEEELTGIALGLKKAGKGVLQLVSDFDDIATELPMLRRIVEASGRPLSIAVAQWNHAPNRWRDILDWVAEVNRDGLAVAAQVPGRPIGLLLGFELSMNPFMYCASYKALANLAVPERLAALRNPELKARIIAEAGALGFSTSRTINHRASDGRHVPTLTAAEEELTGIALGLTRAGKGVLQLVSDFEDLPTELPMLRRIVETSGRPLSIAVGQWHHAPDRWRTILDWVAEVNRGG